MAVNLKRRLKLIDENIARYLQDIASADRQEDSVLASKKTERLEARIAKLNEEVKRLNALAESLPELPDQQLSQTDPDARSLRTRGTGIVGYNVQAAVDAKNHLIIAHEVTNEFSDRSLLSSMAAQAKAALAVDELDVVADRGYYHGEELRACEEASVTAYVPKPQTSNNQAKGLFGKRDFIYRAESDEYECPAGQRLIYRFTCDEKGKINKRYWSSACSTCSIKNQCTTGKQRRVTRWIHEEARLENNPRWMKVRRETVKHTFGTLKCWMGVTHFQMRTLDKVATEMSLHVLSYNLKRAINILGVPRLLAAMA